MMNGRRGILLSIFALWTVALPWAQSTGLTRTDYVAEVDGEKARVGVYRGDADDLIAVEVLSLEFEEEVGGVLRFTPDSRDLIVLEGDMFGVSGVVEVYDDSAVIRIEGAELRFPRLGEVPPDGVGVFELRSDGENFDGNDPNGTWVTTFVLEPEAGGYVPVFVEWSVEGVFLARDEGGRFTHRGADPFSIEFTADGLRVSSYGDSYDYTQRRVVSGFPAPRAAADPLVAASSMVSALLVSYVGIADGEEYRVDARFVGETDPAELQLFTKVEGGEVSERLRRVDARTLEGPFFDTEVRMEFNDEGMVMDDGYEAAPLTRIGKSADGIVGVYELRIDEDTGEVSPDGGMLLEVAVERETANYRAYATGWQMEERMAFVREDGESVVYRSEYEDIVQVEFGDGFIRLTGASSTPIEFRERTRATVPAPAPQANR